MLDVCAGHYLTLQALAELLNRQPASLRNSYLTPMVRDKKLALAFPTTPTPRATNYCLAESLQGLKQVTNNKDVQMSKTRVQMIIETLRDNPTQKFTAVNASILIGSQ